EINQRPTVPAPYVFHLPSRTPPSHLPAAGIQPTASRHPPPTHLPRRRDPAMNPLPRRRDPAANPPPCRRDPAATQPPPTQPSIAGILSSRDSHQLTSRVTGIRPSAAFLLCCRDLPPLPLRPSSLTCLPRSVTRCTFPHR
uniref:Uncharacterized protein n=1 Tax=Triticum urartu TaxID=4572 RepID=A0A8R7UC48_TRIUA